jgi:mRNA-degrading endonuclease RelE of RelBE toxin-antitoxin system
VKDSGAGRKLNLGMAYNVRSLSSFDKSLSKLDDAIALRVVEKISRIAENPDTIPRQKRDCSIPR